MISIFLSPFITVYCCLLIFIIGLCMGSFLNCAAWRIVSGESFLTGRSHCPKCGHVLGVSDLFPLFSWLLLKGKCRYCKADIPARYPLTELCFALICLVNLLVFDLSAELIRALLLCSSLFVLSIVDFDSYIIPDGCHIFAVIMWGIFSPFLCRDFNAFLLSLLSAAVYGGGMLLLSLIMDKILKKDSLGGGDIKLFAVMGLYLGFVSSLFALFFSCIIGLCFAFVSGRRRKPSDNDSLHIPFGPSIALSFWLMLLFGDKLSSWYLGLMGL